MLIPMGPADFRGLCAKLNRTFSPCRYYNTITARPPASIGDENA
jgi:hypothetical protein